MIVRFWGVRGSLPTPITPQQVQSKIMAVIQRISPDDLVSEDARAKFLASLPDWIYGTTGGNTPCVEISAGNAKILLDAGTGIRVFGKSKFVPENHHYHLFFSHFHWDHIQGLPFFDDAYNPKSVFEIYSAHEDPKKYLSEQMNQPYYPVPFEALTKNFRFHSLKPGCSFRIADGLGSKTKLNNNPENNLNSSVKTDKSDYITNDSISDNKSDDHYVKVSVCEMNHPGKSFSYSFTYEGKKVIYATDVELKANDYFDNPAAQTVFKDADVLILDSQYTVEEAYRKENWGHSAFCYAVDFAVHWNIKHLYLYHHEPTYDDKKLNSILQAARWYAEYTEHSNIKIDLAKEGLELDL